MLIGLREELTKYNLQEKPSAVQREISALQNIRNFFNFLFCCVLVARLKIAER
jgi:hypothetical protein